MEDHVIRCLVSDPLVRVVAVLSTGVAREAATRHGAVAGAQVALGRAATAGLLLATLTKGGERVTLRISGDGGFGEILADATDAGDVRAYAQCPEHLVPMAAGQRLPIGAAVGRGTVSVLRDLGLKERFTGQSPIISGEIDADVEHYLRTSEQVESALGCEVELASSSEVRVAAGLLVQCMPGGEGLELVQQVRHQLRNGKLFAALGAGEYAEDIARELLGEAGARLDVLDIRPVQFKCRCSLERVLGALSSVSEQEMSSMIEVDGGAEIVCDFCRERYQIDVGQLEQLRQARAGRASS